MGVFAWEVRNVASGDVDVSVMLTWENAISPNRRPAKGDFSKVGKLTDRRIVLELGHERTDDGYPVSFGLAVEGDENTTVSRKESFNTDSKGEEVWRDFRSEGQLPSQAGNPPEGNHRMGAALCAKTEIPPGETAELVFALSWDIPIMQFGLGRRWYRRYTRFFDASGENAIPIAELALDKWRDWERRIVEWQRPIIDSDRPAWLKCALFNELYHLVDGGTAWETGEVGSGIRKEGGWPFRLSGVF